MAENSSSANAGIVMTEPVRGGLARWNEGACATLNNFDGDARHKFALRMRCNAADVTGDNVLNQPIAIKYWSVTEVDFIDQETGVAKRSFRVCFIDAQQKSWAVCSDVVASGVQDIFKEFGTAPLDPPLRMKVVERRSAAKRRFFVLVPADIEPEQPELVAKEPPATKRKAKPK